MTTLFVKILQILGWRTIGNLPDIKKRVIIFAPHTAHIDALYGKLGITEIDVIYDVQDN